MIRNIAQELINACFEEVSNDRVRMEGFGSGGGGGGGGGGGAAATTVHHQAISLIYQ